MKNFVPKPLGFRKFSYFSEMWNDALMHREGLEGYLNPFIMKVVIILLQLVCYLVNLVIHVQTIK